MTGFSFDAIGTTAHLLVDRPASGCAGAERLLREFLDDLDRACSRFRADSALSRLNHDGGPVAVDPLLLAAIRVALRAAHASGGLVDPTLGVSLAAIGYDRDFADVVRSAEAVPPAVPVEPVAPVAPAGSWRDVRIDGDTVTLPAGFRLDLGATCKAWAADVAAEQLAAELGCAVLVNLGGDIAVGGPRDPGWRVGVSQEHADCWGSGPKVTVRPRGVATSSTLGRRWQGRGGPLHHVLDPATGLPAVPVWRYVSVAAASCVEANTAATAAIVLGAAAPAWLADRGLPARLVGAGGQVVTTAGWPVSGSEQAHELEGRPAC